MPAKTIYVSEDDLPLYQRAQQIAGGNLSAAISLALRRYVEVAEGHQAGYDEIVVRVGIGRGRKQRFTGVLLGEWGHSSNAGVETYRVYRTPNDRYVVHVERSKKWTATGPDADKWQSGWRSWIGNWSGTEAWTSTPAEATLHVASSLDELLELLPPELYQIVADIADQPAIEDLDI
jgi:EXLDI family protein